MRKQGYGRMVHVAHQHDTIPRYEDTKMIAVVLWLRACSWWQVGLSGDVGGALWKFWGCYSRPVGSIVINAMVGKSLGPRSPRAIYSTLIVIRSISYNTHCHTDTGTYV